MRRTVVLTFILCLVAAVPAYGSHRPSHRSLARMNSAVRGSEFMPPPIRQGRFHLHGARVSTRGPWAKATVVPAGSLKRRLDPALAIFHRRGAGWRVVGVGTAEVGCEHPRLPGKVRRDLGLSCLSARAADARAPRAVSGSCSPVHGRGRTAYRVRAYDGLGCRAARGRLHHWLRQGFPRNQFGWYCEMSSARKLCSLGNGAAPVGCCPNGAVRARAGGRSKEMIEI
jgi:hypothetical protein